MRLEAAALFVALLLAPQVSTAANPASAMPPLLVSNMALIDVTHPDRAATGGSIDLRGDTDDTWLAGVG